MTRATNHRLEVASEKRQKKEEIVEKQKTRALAAKRQRARKGISLSNKKEQSYEIDTRDNIDLDQVNDEYSLQL